MQLRSAGAGNINLLGLNACNYAEQGQYCIYIFHDYANIVFFCVYLCNNTTFFYLDTLLAAKFYNSACFFAYVERNHDFVVCDMVNSGL